MQIHDVVMRLIGPVEPVGETRTDDQRLASLEQLTGLVDGLLEEIRGIAERHKHSHESSVKRAADLCDKFLRTVAEELSQSPAPVAVQPSQWQEPPREIMEACEAEASAATFQGFACSVAADKINSLSPSIYRMGFQCGWEMRGKCDALARQPLPPPPLSASPEDKPK